MDLRVLKAINRERDRQDAKWGEQNHRDGTGPRVVAPGWLGQRGNVTMADLQVWAKVECQRRADAGETTWLWILLEEVFEAAECRPFSPELKEELVQVAAVVVEWLEDIERRRDPIADRIAVARAQ